MRYEDWGRPNPRLLSAQVKTIVNILNAAP